MSNEIKCRYPATYVAHRLRDWLDNERPWTGWERPDVFKETPTGQVGLGFQSVTLTHQDGAYRVQVMGLRCTFNGQPLDSRGTPPSPILTVEILPLTQETSEAHLWPTFEGASELAEDVEATIVASWREEIGEEGGDSGHYAHPSEKRREIAEAYRRKAHMYTQEAFARRHSITDRTLRNYLNEFPQEEET